MNKCKQYKNDIKTVKQRIQIYEKNLDLPRFLMTLRKNRKCLYSAALRSISKGDNRNTNYWIRLYDNHLIGHFSRMYFWICIIITFFFSVIKSSWKSQPSKQICQAVPYVSRKPLNHTFAYHADTFFVTTVFLHGQTEHVHYAEKVSLHLNQFN